MNRDRSPTDASRRRFLAIAGAASAVCAGSLAVAAMPAPASQCFAVDDGELVALEKEIFEQRRLAEAFDPEMVNLQQPHWNRHDEALERMFAIPAQTAAGRAAKASAVLGLIDTFMLIDEDEGYPMEFVRKLLTEFVGETLRDGAPIAA